ncbi:hypothetical protein BDZ91DRAFT_367654 [Kalaharituber pfeilii]|nr:hypothetical protein BDZ91DRAFT_367654 [Kalaharituber pfeilii]
MGTRLTEYYMFPLAVSDWLYSVYCNFSVLPLLFLKFCAHNLHSIRAFSKLCNEENVNDLESKHK